MPDPADSHEVVIHVPVPDREVLDIIEASYRTRPRIAATREAFDELVRSLFVPYLKSEGFNKRNLTWFRKGSRVWPLIQVCKGRADGDFLEFWVEWGLHVSGYQSWRSGTSGEVLSPMYSPLRGTEGDFARERFSRHWMVALGRVGEYTPTQAFRDIAPDIKGVLEILVPYLDRFTTIDSIVRVLRMDNVAESPYPPASMPSSERQRALATLEEMARAESD